MENKKEVPEYKLEIVKELAGLLDSKKTIMIASIKGLPARQFQKIKKQLSKDVDIKIVKKRAFVRAVEGSKKEKIDGLKDHIKEDIAILISDMDAFELSAKLSESKSPVKAKVGQIAEEDVVIKAGPTELPAGPAVSELGSLGLIVKVAHGKIEIQTDKVIVKKGKEITENAAGVMGKLDILPFSVGFIPLIAYDSDSKVIFSELVIDKDATLEDMKQMFAKSTSLAVNLGYICKETLGLLLSKASSHEKVLAGFVKEEPKAEVPAEKVEEKPAEPETKEEPKTASQDVPSAPAGVPPGTRTSEEVPSASQDVPSEEGKDNNSQTNDTEETK